MDWTDGQKQQNKKAHFRNKRTPSDGPFALILIDVTIQENANCIFITMRHDALWIFPSCPDLSSLQSRF